VAPLSHVKRRRVSAPARLFLVDVMHLAITGPLSRPGRSVLTTLGTILGVGMLVVTLGLTSSAHARINQSFDALDATEVQAQSSPDAQGAAINDESPLRARALGGVTDAGIIRTEFAPEPTVTVSPLPIAASIAQNAETSPDVMGASPGALTVMDIRLGSGTTFTAAEESVHAHVALLGVAAAGQLGVQHVPATIYVDGIAFLAQGIVASAAGDNDALIDVVIPEGTAESLDDRGNVSATVTLIVRTRVGYAASVGNSLAATVDPRSPSSVTVTTPPSPIALGAEVSSDVTLLFIVLGGVGLIVGIVGIANTTLVSVLERVSEIGLRRAVGARRGQIALQFVCESLALGTLGGVFGAALGIAAVSAVSAANGWTPVMTPYVVLLAPCVGAGTGLLAGLYPAYHAASIDPRVALGR